MLKLNRPTWFRTRVSSQGDYCCSAAELCADMPDSPARLRVYSLVRESQTYLIVQFIVWKGWIRLTIY